MNAEVAGGALKRTRREVFLAASLFCTVFAVVTGRVACSALFLELPRYARLLPYIYVASAIVVPLVMLLYAKAVRRYPRAWVNAWSLALAVLVTLGFRGLLARGGVTIYFSFYLWVEVYGTALVVQLWSQAGELFDTRTARRAFPSIAAGGVLASVAAGFSTSFLTPRLGTENLLLLVALSLCASFVLVSRLGRGARRREPARRMVRASGSFSRYALLLAVVIIAVQVVVALTDYQFQVIVAERIVGKDARGAFFGLFFGVTGLIAAIFQLAITRRLLSRFGVLAGLLVLPLCMLLGALGFASGALIPAFFVISGVKGADSSLRYSLNDSAMQLLYMPISPARRGRIKALIDGTLKPIALGLTGLAMVVLARARLEPTTLAWPVLAFLLLWLFLLVPLGREYDATLFRALERRLLDFTGARLELTDEKTLAALRAALCSCEPVRVLHALELTALIDEPGRAALTAQILPLLTHASDVVRIAALVALPFDASRVATLLADTSPSVRARAVVELLRHGRQGEKIAGIAALEAMLASRDAPARARGVWVLGEVAAPAFYPRLKALLADEDLEVRRAALAAAAKSQVEELLPFFMQALADPARAREVEVALAAFGEVARPALIAVLGDERRDEDLRARACRVLGKIASVEDDDLIWRSLTDGCARVRDAAVAALATRGGVGIRRKVVARALRLEAERAVALRDAARIFEDCEQAVLLHDGLWRRQREAQERVLGLVGLGRDAGNMEIVRHNLRSSSATLRANALELLDRFMSSRERRFVISCFESEGRAAPRDVIARESLLSRLVEGEDVWLRVCAAHAIGAGRHHRLLPLVRGMLRDRSALCREAALFALAQLLSREALGEAARGACEDESPLVRRYALTLSG